MKIHKRVRLGKLYQNHEVLFGQATTDDELNEVFSLRFKVYSERGYIESSKYPTRLEIDKYDKEGKSIYFIAVYCNKIIGCIRIIKTEPLPTRIYFHFETPDPMKSFPKDELCELGRFVIIPPDRQKGIYLPRGLVMLLLIDTLSKYGIDNNLNAGYSFVKESLVRKMKKLDLPFHKICDYKEDYPKDAVLYRYFTQVKDPVYPIYFLTSEFKNFCDKTIKRYFKASKEDSSIVILKDSLFMKVLRAFKII